jgi:hypothetical protein
MADSLGNAFHRLRAYVHPHVKHVITQTLEQGDEGETYRKPGSEYEVKLMHWSTHALPVIAASTLILGAGLSFSERLPLDGLTIAVKGDADFESVVNSLTFESPADQGLLPYGVIVRNNGQHNVVAYSMQWVFADGGGEPILKETNYVQTFALNDGPRPGPGRFGGDIVLAPGNSRLITPSLNYLLDRSMNSPISSSGLIGETRFPEFVSGIDKKPFKTVRLAGYVLQDGTCVQLTISDLCSTVQAHVDASQDVFKEATSRTYEKDPSRFVEGIRTTLAQRHAAMAEFGSDTYRFQYNTMEDTMLRVIRSQLERGSYNEMLSSAAERMYHSRPVIRQRDHI